MAKKQKTQSQKPKTTTKKEVTEIPEFYDEDKQLKTLKQRDFPTTKDGRMAWCDYQVERWKVRKEEISKRMDPLAKKKRKRERLQEQLKKLEEELAEEEAEATEE
jgi:uncharacterized protein YigA (DUF484 family)